MDQRLPRIWAFTRSPEANFDSKILLRRLSLLVVVLSTFLQIGCGVEDYLELTSLSPPFSEQILIEEVAIDGQSLTLRFVNPNGNLQPQEIDSDDFEILASPTTPSASPQVQTMIQPSSVQVVEEQQGYFLIRLFFSSVLPSQSTLQVNFNSQPFFLSVVTKVQ